MNLDILQTERIEQMTPQFDVICSMLS